jgi:hypothetical protein
MTRFRDTHPYQHDDLSDVEPEIMFDKHYSYSERDGTYLLGADVDNGRGRIVFTLVGDEWVLTFKSPGVSDATAAAATILADTVGPPVAVAHESRGAAVSVVVTEWRVVESNDPRGFDTVCRHLAVNGWVYAGHEGDVLHRPPVSGPPSRKLYLAVEPAWFFVRNMNQDHNGG